jgi:putative colanic acid biosynthesis acetyltransferase WcaF
MPYSRRPLSRDEILKGRIHLNQSDDETNGAGPRLDVAANRAVRKWSRKQLVGRAIWGLVHPLFALSPRPFWAWRRALLRAFGAQIGRDVHVFPSVLITIPWNITIGDESAIGDRAILYALGPITVGKRTTISQGAHLCAGTHDYRDPTMPLLKMPIVIGDEAWISADAFVGPGATVGDRTIVGARAVVMKAIGTDLIVVGNPARVLKTGSDNRQ